MKFVGSSSWVVELKLTVPFSGPSMPSFVVGCWSRFRNGGVGSKWIESCVVPCWDVWSIRVAHRK